MYSRCSGFGFILVKRDCLEACKGLARSVSLDLYDQWNTMEQHNGKWRFTSPTHVVRAFIRHCLSLRQKAALLHVINVIYKTNKPYLKVCNNWALNWCSVKSALSTIITTFLYPTAETFSFQSFYETLKKSGYVIYPGKVTDLNCFRIGNIGEVYIQDIEGLLCCDCQLLRKPSQSSCNSITFIKTFELKGIHYDDQQYKFRLWV